MTTEPQQPQAMSDSPATPDAPPAPAPSSPPVTGPVPVSKPDLPAPPPAPTKPVADAPKAADPEPAIDAQMEAEIAAAMSEMDAAAAAAETHHPKKRGIRGPRKVEGGREHRAGTIVSVGPKDIFIEFGPKELGVLERTGFKADDTLPSVGDTLEVVVLRFDAAESLFICVMPGSIVKADWELLRPGQDVEARVTGVNKGGLELEVAGHRAFMPAGQVGIDRIPDLSILVGEKMTCRVQRLDRSGKGNIVLSRRELVQEERARTAVKLRDMLKEGDQLDGTVRKIMDFGCFVDIGGIDGLVHLSDLSYERVNHGAKSVAKFVSEGQKVRVQILKLDWDANRIGLGIKQLQADPFEAAASEVVEGATMSGKVTNILDFGCFVEVAPGVEGLVHISEMAWQRVDKVESIVQVDEVIQVRVLKIDPESRKISLSIKQTTDAPKREGGGGRGKGRGRGERDDRTVDEIQAESPALRRLKEQSKTKGAQKSGGGIGNTGGLGIGLGDLKL